MIYALLGIKFWTPWVLNYNTFSQYTLNLVFNNIFLRKSSEELIKNSRKVVTLSKTQQTYNKRKLTLRIVYLRSTAWLRLKALHNFVDRIEEKLSRSSGITYIVAVWRTTYVKPFNRFGTRGVFSNLTFCETDLNLLNLNWDEHEINIVPDLLGVCRKTTFKF